MTYSKLMIGGLLALALVVAPMTTFAQTADLSVNARVEAQIKKLESLIGTLQGMIAELRAQLATPSIVDAKPQPTQPQEKKNVVASIVGALKPMVATKLKLGGSNQGQAPKATECKGDMDGNGLVNNFDIDAFTKVYRQGQASLVPTTGKVNWYVDMDGNGRITSADEDLFVAAINGTHKPACR